MHELIAGTTLSGKTTLARRKAALYTAAGRHVIVLDELMDPKWISEGGAVFLTDDPEEFQKVFWSSRNCAVFIDEAGESVGRYDKEMSKVATRGRHWGHIGHFIVQSPSMIDRNVRRNCAGVYAFAMEDGDAETLSKEYIQPMLREASSLNQGEYIHAVRFGKDKKPFAVKGKVF